MERENFDIFVSGGGLSGLIAACAFGRLGLSVLCVDPQPPVTTQGDPKADRRSTAFLQPAKATLEHAGLWPRFAPYAAPLQMMRLADAGGEPGEIRYLADFDAGELSDQPFGWNLPNWLLRRELLAQINQTDNITLRMGVKTNRITARAAHALVSLSDGTQMETPLVVAADGRNSPIREMLDIGVKTWRYGQKAIVFTVSHPRPHNNISTEIHRSGGPFTLVPLPDLYGVPQSAVVWMETGPKAAALMELDEVAFTAKANLRACDILGPLTVNSPRNIWPIISQKAERLTGPHTALIAEAAHVVPPIGAQGLNMSLGDVQVLVDLLESGHAAGSSDMLAAYERKRMPDITARVSGVDMLNRAALAQSPDLRALRLKGLQLLNETTPLRRAAMRAGLGA
ncbi:UbiH/UbiF family hydroxylase [Neptunicoccus cionae]|uniref:UbiH/UbiF family hydroxylase n=1 Tax=Neptunicoccus cionae TaxID=2035344 RepID=UPI000C75DA7E|nr:UbiH/UbiF family hydroxylase [Amylibacter cionae]PLS20761.1 2-octaprenyl-6-methoxyphenyl hydroxylase [Amylibacter cionae]